MTTKTYTYVTTKDVEKIRELRKKGLTCQKIGRMLDLSTSTVHNYVKKDRIY